MDPAPIHFSLKSAGRIRILLSGFILILGSAVYILFRPGEYLFFRWAGFFGLDLFISNLRDHTSSFHLHLPEWFIYSLPGGLWAFALTLIISTIWSGSTSRLKYFWLALVTGLVLGFELLQLAAFIPGVFCWQDFFFGTAGLASGFCFETNPKKSV